MTYETLNNLENDWNKVGLLRFEKEDGQIVLRCAEGKNSPPEMTVVAMTVIWNQIPKMVEEMRLLSSDHERMSTFLRAIQQISVDAMRCTSKMERVVDWYQTIPEGAMREMEPADLLALHHELKGEKPEGKE